MATPKNKTPPSLLAYHRILAPNAGIRVSPLCLGAMNFGEAWKEFLGECSKDNAFEILDYFYEKGGNFIDTANAYQNGESEEWLGEWMESRGVRDEMVIATKFSGNCRKQADPSFDGPRPRATESNLAGNSTKSLFRSVESSLKRLRTTYIDVLYLHWWDFSTSVPEVMKSLNTLADQGKILYLGVSDTPAWIVSKANQYARDHGLRPFVVYQGRWSAAQRDFEREIIPMCESEGMAIAPWGALGGGNFKTEEQRKSQEGRKQRPPPESVLKVSKALEKKAQEKQTAITSIAMAYVMHQTPNVFPIVGTRKLEHLKGNIDALSIKLSPEDIAEIEDAVEFEHGFPLSFLFVGQKKPSFLVNDVSLSNRSWDLDVVQKPKPIEPRAQP